MTEIGFYHLTRTPLDQALPKLLGRVLGDLGEFAAQAPQEDDVTLVVAKVRD